MALAAREVGRPAAARAVALDLLKLAGLLSDASAPNTPMPERAPPTAPLLLAEESP
jgi:hypothetical protein